MSSSYEFCRAHLGEQTWERPQLPPIQPGRNQATLNLEAAACLLPSRLLEENVFWGNKMV